MSFAGLVQKNFNIYSPLEQFEALQINFYSSHTHSYADFVQQVRPILELFLKSLLMK